MHNPIIWLESTDSTSAYLQRMLSGSFAEPDGSNGPEGGAVPSGTVVASLFQTSGRGQGDHSWHSESGQNLLFSIYMEYSAARRLAARDQQLVTMASSLAVCDFLAQTGIPGSCIKLPNDIYVNGLKICGMLIENSLFGADMNWTIVGMGINVNQREFPSELPNPVSISLLTGVQYDITKCLEDFLRHFVVRFDAIWTEPSRLKDEFLQKTAAYSESVRHSYGLCG